LRQRAVDDFETEFRVHDRDGRWHWVMARGRVVERDAQGQPARMVGMHHDITASHRASDALSLSQAKFQTIYEALPDAAGITRISDGRYLEVNPAFCRLLRRTREEILGHTSLELNIWATPEERTKLLARFREKGLVDSLPCCRAQRQRRPSRVACRRARSYGGRALLHLPVPRHQRTPVHAGPAGAGERTAATGRPDCPPGRLGGLARAGRALLVRVCYELHGLPPGSPVPEHYVDQYVAPAYRELFRGAMRRAVTERQAFEHEIQVQRADGRLIWVQAMGEPVIQDGQVRSVRGVIRDIDEARRSLDRLRESEERFARIFNAIPDPMGICSKATSRYLEVNPAWEQAMGSTAARR
jgi:PAS domain S-box-containing protein